MPHLFGLRHHQAEALRTALIGGLSAIGMVTYYRLFNQVPATTLIMAYYTYPLFAIVIGCLFFGIPATRNRFITAAMIAVAVLMTLDNPNVTGLTWKLWFAAFVPPISFAVLLNYFSNPVKPLSSGARIGSSLFGHMLVLIPLMFWLQPVKVLPAMSADLIWIAALGLLSAAIPQYLFARGSVQAGLETTTTIGSMEIVFAMAFTAIFLGDDLGRSEYLAAILIVMSSLIRLEPPAEIAPQPVPSVLNSAVKRR